MADSHQRPKPIDTQLGALVRLHALSPTQLPAHPDLAHLQASNTSPDLAKFFGNVLTEAEYFITTYLHSNFKEKPKKESSPAVGKIQVLAHDVEVNVPVKGSITEAWFARISRHENAVKDGTASFEEFDAGLRSNHSFHEKEYTPDIEDAHLVLDWSTALDEIGGKIGSWQDVQIEIREMIHHLPPPLSKRHFSALVVAGRRANAEFIVAQLPVDLRGVTKAKYADDASKTAGIYVSIEYGRLIENGARTEWTMATASDAGGSLPMWAQKMGLPGAIIKDVGLFVAWRQQQRKERRS